MAIDCQRHLFEIPDDIAYLNCAYMSPLLRRARQAGEHGLAMKSRPWEITPANFFEVLEKARALFGQIVGADADGISVLPAASYGLALAAKNIGVAPGQTILVLDGQFPSNIYCWRDLAERSGGRVVMLRRSGARDWTTTILDAMADDTAIVAAPQCHWVDGTVIDLERIGARCREVGAALVTDLTQTLGVMPFDVAAIQPDFAIAATYKWLLGPYSLGFAYIAPKWRSGTPLEYSWMGRKDSDDFNTIMNYTHDYRPGVRRFDVGEPSNFALMPAAVAGMEQLLEWGIGDIAATLRTKTDGIAGRAQALGLGMEPRDIRAPHYLTLKWPETGTGDLLQKLADHKVFISMRGGSPRITPHVYNDDGDIERLMSALEEAV